MDQATLEYYARHAREVSERYEGVGSDDGIAYYVRYAFPEPCKILDVGCGSGRDAARLLANGYDVYGVEPCVQLVHAITQLHPELSARVACAGLPDLGNPFQTRFEGIICSAVLMHLPRAEIFEAICALKDLLEPEGRILLSVPIERPGLDEFSRDSEGRLFLNFDQGELNLLFARVGLQRINSWVTKKDALNREGFHWYTVLFQLTENGSYRPLDRISAIIRQDKKDATYKFALLRSLAEIAMSNFNQARWVADGRVGVPIDLVAQKWFEYYWPIMAQSQFIPQKQGEKKICTKPIAFRRHMERLIELYPESTGGLAAFNHNHKHELLSPDASEALEVCLKKIIETIKKGPVYYAGLSSVGKQFDYDVASKMILMDSGLWSEFSLLSSWLIDALILRWAQFTAQIGRDDGLELNHIIAILLSSPMADRDVALSKRLFASLPDLLCVWTEKPIKKLAIDHMIPFTMWRNNDLWNLLPSNEKINSSKSDKLPARSLIHQRRDLLIYYWELYESANQKRFEQEINQFVGKQVNSKNWQSELFNTVVHAIEFTALQTGCQRWMP